MNQYKKVAFHTLGCKLNFSETSTISRLFTDAGFARVDFADQPDIYVINTCSVTNNADKECKKLVRKALKINPDAFVAIIGCYAQLKPTEIAEIDGVDLVLGANEKFNLLEHVEDLRKKKEATVFNTEIKQVHQFFPAYSSGDRTRTFLKVQDGCDYFCSFCTIPLARGFSRSANIAKTIAVATEVAGTEAREVVLTGVNLGDFGSGTEENFFGLIRELERIDGIDRYRISSIEPNLLSTEIIEHVAASAKFAPHFHIPLQSGSDKILESMRRRYKSDLYRDRVSTIKSLMPHCCIGVDVIVGFPDETDEDFMDTYNFLNELEVSYFHVFTYSERDNTTAVRKPELAVPMNIRAERSKKLHILSDKKKRKFYEDNVGREGVVLFEGEEDNGLMYGFSENYIKVRTPFDAALVNKMAKVKFTAIAADGNMTIETDLESMELLNPGHLSLAK
ncbi:MAG: tRNA (N(6)-L-threonylcarbamoyladenosine(37)-C(2))-methylthiotransferase MtaB [Bacteroidota bacterium]